MIILDHITLIKSQHVHSISLRNIYILTNTYIANITNNFGMCKGPEVNFFLFQPLWQVDLKIHLPQTFYLPFFCLIKVKPPFWVNIVL